MAQTEQEILAGVAELINAETGVAVEDVQPEKTFTELEIDSLSMATIVVEAEERFDVKIPDEDIADLTTVQSVVSYIQQAQSA